MRAWALVLLVACGGDDVATVPIADGGIISDPDGGADAAIGGGSALSHTLFVNAEGVSVTSGADDATANTSSVVGNGATLAKFLATDAQRATKIADIKTQLDGILSPYHVTVTLTRPAAGPYDMIVLTDDSSAKIGLAAGTAAVVSTTCNTADSVVGFSFGGTDRNLVARDTIAMLGITAAIPTSNKAGDCMCLADSACATLAAPCTIGHAGTAVSATASCPASGATMDENALFLASFGAH